MEQFLKTYTPKSYIFSVKKEKWRPKLYGRQYFFANFYRISDGFCCLPDDNTKKVLNFTGI